uniref:Uncharacterized protein n=1 Tax=Panagrolaimus superbus TaxID=310955 RepID=A0A914YYZ2_9BILA
MAGRKNPHNGFFGNPPSVNFFTSHDEEEEEHEKNSDEELEEKIRMHHSAVNEAHNGVLKSVDSEIFDKSPFSPAMTSGSGSHNVSSPFEIAQYPIEIQEGKKAIQRQISER